MCSAAEKPYIASMGIYVMKANALKELLEQHMPDANDFGNEVIPGARTLGYPVQVRIAALLPDLQLIDAPLLAHCWVACRTLQHPASQPDAAWQHGSGDACSTAMPATCHL